MKADLEHWERTFYRLLEWLDCDRDRRTAVFSADLIFDILRVELRIDGRIASVATGFDFPDIVAEAMNGMIVESDDFRGKPVEEENRMTQPANNVGRPRVVCLCGSNRFWRDYIDQNIIETMAGRIVISVGGFISSDPKLPAWMAVKVSPEMKVKLDELHLRKIDLADEILVLNRGGYVGESTMAEITYATATGKPIRWMEPPQG